MDALLIAILLFVLGAVLGSFANWAIYQLGYFRVRAISPLGPLHPQASPRRWQDRIPILGWWWLRRDGQTHGRGFWLRPMLIELSMAIGAVVFYRWQMAGGLVGGRVRPLEGDAELWFAGHCLLFWLLTVATFIDFDEKTIPDWITVPGTLAGLALAVFAVRFRLPEVVTELGGSQYRAITFASPFAIGDAPWHRDWRGLLVALAICAAWTVALLPKTLYWRRGLLFGGRILWGSILRPARKRAGRFQARRRHPFGLTKILLVAFCGLALLVVAVDALGGTRWDSLFGSLLGLAYGGGLVWAVRCVASWSMQQEAMGFGDVTLAAMIGSFLGWQASLIVFIAAPFAALLIAVIQFVFTRNREIAFGPYLALAAVLVVAGWYTIWLHSARPTLLWLGIWLHVIMAICLVAMGAMLLGIRAMKGSEQ